MDASRSAPLEAVLYGLGISGIGERTAQGLAGLVGSVRELQELAAAGELQAVTNGELQGTWTMMVVALHAGHCVGSVPLAHFSMVRFQ